MHSTIVIGGNHHNTLGVVRSLGKAGIYPYVVLTTTKKDPYVLKSKYIRDSWVVENSEAAINFIQKHFNQEEKPIIFVCHDIIASLVDLYSTQLSKNFIIPGSNVAGKITSLMDKKRMGDLAQSVGFNVPAMYEISADFPNDIVDILEYPIITKPVASKDGSKDDIVVCNDKKELENFLRERKGQKYIVQHFIIKDYEYQLIGCSFHGGQEIIIPGVSELIRPNKTTNTGFLRYININGTYADVLNKCRTFIQKIGFSGLFSIEFLRDKQGCDFFMEMNFRNDGNTISVMHSGVNLPYLWYLHCVGEDIHNGLGSIHDEYVMPEFDEVSMFRSGYISRKMFVSDMKRATSYMEYDASDPAPTKGRWQFWCRRLTAEIVVLVKKLIRYK